MQAVQSTSMELFKACETIFGSDVKVSFDFLTYLQPVRIKTAYRKRAFETHPDRAKALGTFTEDLNTEFINVHEAYERLLSFVETKNGSNMNAPLFNRFGTQQYSGFSARQNKGGQKKNHHHKRFKSYTDHFYSGGLPKSNLMFGQFLYYSGLISWRTLIDAICWQRRQRPLIGQIAVGWGLISSREIMHILRVRTFNEKFGECALRIGYISSFEQFALVGKQRRIQRPFGEYFIENGILSSDDLMSIARKQQLHNITSYR